MKENIVLIGRDRESGWAMEEENEMVGWRWEDDWNCKLSKSIDSFYGRMKPKLNGARGDASLAANFGVWQLGE